MSLDTWKTAHFGGYDRILVSKDTLDHTSNYKKRMRPACVAGPCRKTKRLHRAMQNTMIIPNDLPTIPLDYTPTAFPPS